MNEKKDETKVKTELFLKLKFQFIFLCAELNESGCVSTRRLGNFLLYKIQSIVH
jgi:hypothetical protein